MDRYKKFDIAMNKIYEIGKIIGGLAKILCQEQLETNLIKINL